MIAAAVSLLLGSGMSLAPSDSFADNTDRSFIYTPEVSSFKLGKASSSGVKRFEASSRNEPYSLAGYKKIASIKFELENVPLGSNIEMCVVSQEATLSGDILEEGIETEKVYCENRSLVNSSEISVEVGDLGGVVDSSSIYYCGFVLVNSGQIGIENLAFEGVRADCEVVFDPLEEGDDSQYQILSYGNDDYSVGPQIYSEVLSLAEGRKTQVVAIGSSFVYADNLGQSAGNEEVCVINTSSGESYCSSGSDQGVHYLQDSVNIDASDSLGVSCEVSSGRLGKCNVNLLLQIVD